MTRLILTLLAVLTGLLAQVSPANARMSGASRAEVAVAVQVAGTIARAAVVPAGRPENVAPALVAPRRACASRAVAADRTALIGIDRARE